VGGQVGYSFPRTVSEEEIHNPSSPLLPRHLQELRHIMGNSPSVIDRFYKGAISQVEVEKFGGLGWTRRSDEWV